MQFKRVICLWSAGITSAVATKLALDKYKETDIPIHIVYCDTASEHPDNKRFLKDCQDWYGQEIIVLKSEQYEDIYDVFNKTSYMSGRFGARCTVELKKNTAKQFVDLETDLQVYGYDAKEKVRAKRFEKNNPEVMVWFPLIEKGYTKGDCLLTIMQASIDIPKMYKLGYRNNNCIGCVKGAMGYWNKIRRDFPEEFERTAKISRELNVKLIDKVENGQRKRYFLDELDPSWGDYKSELPIECGIYCPTGFGEEDG